MKMFIRGFIFTILAVNVSMFVVDTLKFGDDKIFFLVILALALLNLFLRPLMDMVSLPSSGPVFWILSWIMNIIILNVLTVVVSSFTISAASTHSLLIFGFMLPSKNLSALLAGCVA